VSGPAGTRTRPVVPGTDPAALRLITAAVLAGLVASGIVLAARHGQAPGGAARPARAGAQALIGPGVHLRARGAAGAPPVRLLSRAARASGAVAYRGEEVLDVWGLAGPATVMVDVWHAPGGMTLAQPVTPAPHWPGEAPHIVLPASSLGGQAMVGSIMLGMSQRLAALLAANYRLRLGGWGHVAGRPARVLLARSHDGALAARLWLDAATALPLRRQTFDGRGRMVSEASFTTLALGPAAVVPRPGAAAAAWHDALGAGRLARLRAAGWPVPGTLPGGLVLVGAREGATPGGRAVDLDYSDGLCLVSVFLQRGHLPPRPAGWARMALAGHAVYADYSGGQSLVWPAGGYVYTLVAAAPPRTVAQVVAALPHGSSPGILARMAQGMRRLLSWLTP
jgi:sigma-E factor negative regulatory protein RseB